ncbi:hypothetical protein D3C87_1690690 [compost metagenome]
MAGARQVAGRGVDAQLQVAHAARHQGQVGQFAAAHHAVHVFRDEVHDAVTCAHVQLDVGILRVEGGQRRYQDHARQGAGHVDPQAAPW